jgi:hypothetical protein
MLPPVNGRGAQMPEYRIYTIDGNGHIAGPPSIIVVPDDQAAREKAKQGLDGHTIEVWIGPRRIAKFDPLHR